MEIQKAGSFKFLFLASWLLVAYPAAWAQEAPAQDKAADFLAIPLPEVEFDGSALQFLPKAESDAPALPPVKLTPPDLSRTALPPAKRITLIAPEAESPAIISAPVQPVITTSPAPTPVAAAIAASPDVPVPARKPQRAGVVAEAPPQKPKTPVHEIPVQETPVELGAPVKAETVAAAAPLRELPPPPEVMKMVETAIPTEQSGAVLFPVTSRARVKGVLNPAENPTSPAAAETDQETARALSAAMTKQDASRQRQDRETEQAETRGDWWQDDPEIILSAVPYPKKRPTIGMASESFVREARKSLVETYTIVKREGDKMPAIKRAPVTNERLPAPRLSIADIPGDPLASQIVDMSPEDVARALNAMTPASGREQAHLARELSAVAKPRIVRQEGEWIRKGDKVRKEESKAEPQENPVKKLASIPENKAALLPTGPIMLVYQAGEVSLPAESAALIEQNVLENLLQAPATRARIMAYAAASDGKEATSRRVSLARALAVRAFLISRGVDATRLDVRAMGLPQGGAEVADKVDIILVPKAENGKKG